MITNLSDGKDNSFSINRQSFIQQYYVPLLKLFFSRIFNGIL